MKKICFLFVLFAFSWSFNGTVNAYQAHPNRIVRVVDDNYDGVNPSTACTQTVDEKTVTSYHQTIQGAIDYNDSTPAGTGPGDKIAVCPGTYVENVHISGGWKTPLKKGLLIMPYDRTPDNVIVQAADPNKPVFFIENQAGAAVDIVGLKITGATGNVCGIENEDIIIPCSGVRVFCTEGVMIVGNHITGNHHGVIIKDTAPQWPFLATVADNTIDNNIVGVRLQYGYGSYVWSNNITTKQGDPNSIGIYLVDTTFNEISLNNIYNNGGTGTSFKIERSRYDINGNRIYDNYIEDPVIKDNADCYEDALWGETLHLNNWYRRVKVEPACYIENYCDGTINIDSNCPADYYCNPTPYTSSPTHCE